MSVGLTAGAYAFPARIAILDHLIVAGPSRRTTCTTRAPCPRLWRMATWWASPPSWPSSWTSGKAPDECRHRIVPTGPCGTEPPVIPCLCACACVRVCRFPGGTALLPASPLQRAAIRFVTKIFDGGVAGLYGVLMNKDPALDNEKVTIRFVVVGIAFASAHAILIPNSIPECPCIHALVPPPRAQVEAALKLLREINDIFVRASPTGPYFLGETFSLADLAVVPFLARFSILLPFYRGVDLLKLVSTHSVAAR